MDVVVDGATVTVDIQVFAGIDVKVTLDDQPPDDISGPDPILKHVFNNVAPGPHTVHVQDVVGFSETREVLVPPVTIEDSLPAWLTDLIQQQEGEPVANPPASIARYEYKGQTVYFLPQRCCDIFSNLYDADGDTIGHPFLKVVSGVPNSCYSFGGYTLTRDGVNVLVKVFNVKPTDDRNIRCAQVYGTVDTIIPLGSNYDPDTAYTVDVNGETISFRGDQIIGLSLWPTPTSGPTPAPVAGPNNLSLWGVYGAVGFSLQWEDNLENEDSFRIERNGSEIAGVPAGTTSFKDEDLPDGSTFCYRVRAGNEAGFSDYSTEACGTIVWPNLQSLDPAEASAGQCCIQVTAYSGHLRIDGGYDESARPFELYFDRAPVGSIGCYVTWCEGMFTVPSDSSLGDHQVCVQGGAYLTLAVVETPATPSRCGPIRIDY